MIEIKDNYLVIDGVSFSEFKNKFLKNKEKIDAIITRRFDSLHKAVEKESLIVGLRSCFGISLNNLTIQNSFAILELLYKESMEYQNGYNNNRSDDDTSYIYDLPMIYLDNLTYDAAKACVSLIARINEKIRQQNAQIMRSSTRRDADRDVFETPSQKRRDSPVRFTYESCAIDMYAKQSTINSLFRKYTPPAFNDKVIVFEDDLQQWSALSSLVLPFIEDANPNRGIDLKSHLKNDGDWYLRLSTKGRNFLTISQLTKHTITLCYIELKSDRLTFLNASRNEFILPKDTTPEIAIEKFLQFLDEKFGLKNRITFQEDTPFAPSNKNTPAP